MTKETKIMTVREAIKEAMTHEMREDENVFIMEKVAEKRFKKIGGDYDYDSTIKLLIQDFRTQKFGLITLDNYSDLLENEEQNEN